MKPLSFGSSFKITTNERNYNKLASHYGLLDFCDDINIKHRESYKTEKAYPHNSFVNSYFNVPNPLDFKIENYCLLKGINYKKYNSEELLKEKSILSRVKPAPHEKYLVRINAKKLDELIKDNKDNNYKHCYQDYIDYYHDDVQQILSSPNSFSASSLYLNSAEGVEKTLEYIDKFGKDSLNLNSLFINFNQETDEPDHCMYFAMKEAGMKQIPVYVDIDTYRLGDALGLFD